MYKKWATLFLALLIGLLPATAFAHDWSMEAKREAINLLQVQKSEKHITENILINDNALFIATNSSGETPGELDKTSENMEPVLENQGKSRNEFPWFITPILAALVIIGFSVVWYIRKL